ncbi:MAG: hypothetical protein KAR30_08945 [Gammaproteobacteria bacterium]|nr:hypothetical protein [Gammaproteobacteria bacterium]
MKFPSARLRIVIMTLILSGCSTFSQLKLGSQEDIDQWLENDQYGHALSVLTLQEKIFNDEETRRNLKRVKIKASQYDRKQAANIRKLLSKEKWDEAIALLNSSIQNHPDGKQLLRAQKVLQRKQRQHTMNLEAQLLLAKTEWLSKNLRLYQIMLLADPQNQSTKWKIAGTQHELKSSADKLQIFGNNALRKKEYDLADICLSTANRLKPTKELNESLVLLELRSRKTAKKIKTLSDGMKKALKKNDLAQGRKLIAELEKMNDYPFELEKLKQSIVNNIRIKVTKILKQGDILYKNGKIEGAKTVWENALKFEPENEQLHDRISRAERALETLKELKKSKP